MLFRRVLMGTLPRTLLLALVLIVFFVGAAFAAIPDAVQSEDGYVNYQVLPNGDRAWKLGTSVVKKTVELRSGSLVLTSFIGRQADPMAPVAGDAVVEPHEYVQGKPSGQFAIKVDGKLLSATDGGYSFKDSSVKKLSQGELQLDIVLSKQPLQVTKHYIVYPGTGIIREWASYKNIGNRNIEVKDPAFSNAQLMGQDIKNGLSFGWFTGGAAGNDTHLLKIDNVDDKYSRTFSTVGSREHLPLMILFDKQNRHGVTMGWDYCGPWAAQVGSVNGESFHLGIRLDKFSRVMKPGDALDTPVAFNGVFFGDLDDMGNGNLDWQYRYLWQYKNDKFFAQPKYSTEFDGPWWVRCGTEELWNRRLAMDLQFMEFARYAGAGILWNDAAWYDEFGNWNGPDWSQTHKYVKKQGMEMLVWMWSAVALPGSRAEKELGQLQSELKVGPPYLNQSKHETTEWQLKMLDGMVSRWGNFQWRYDFAPALGTDRLAADQEFRLMSKEFMKRHPDCAIDACMGGGNGISYDLASYAQSQQLSDGGTGDYTGYYTSMLLPPDMIYDCFTIMSGQNRKTYDIRCDRVHLRTLPGWIGDPGSKDPYMIITTNTDSNYRPGVTAIRPESVVNLEFIRKDWDLYKYFKSQNVVGRWAHVFRPNVDGDQPYLYYQRMNREGTKGFIPTIRPVAKLDSMPAGAVTVYPKGLVPNLDYDVRLDLSPDVQKRTGADLMANGIKIDSLKPGEIIFLNLPNHPGSGLDKEPPTVPTNVTQKVGTITFTQGVELNWKPARDNNWLSSYEVFRTSPDGTETNLGKASVGTYFFDRSAPTSELALCKYHIRAIDGDGNASAKVEAKIIAGEPETHYGFSGYAPEMGWRGWSYERTYDAHTYQPLCWIGTRGYEGQWADEVQTCWIGRTIMHPNPSEDIARIFTTKRAGMVTLKGCVKKDFTMGVIPSDKCAVRILKNDQQVWPKTGWKIVPLTDAGVSYQLKIHVKPGDRIVHMLRHNENNVSGDITWNPIIQY